MKIQEYDEYEDSIRRWYTFSEAVKALQLPPLMAALVIQDIHKHRDYMVRITPERYFPIVAVSALEPYIEDNLRLSGPQLRTKEQQIASDICRSVSFIPSGHRDFISRAMIISRAKVKTKVNWLPLDILSDSSIQLLYRACCNHPKFAHIFRIEAINEFADILDDEDVISSHNVRQPDNFPDTPILFLNHPYWHYHTQWYNNPDPKYDYIRMGSDIQRTKYMRIKKRREI